MTQKQKKIAAIACAGLVAVIAILAVVLSSSSTPSEAKEKSYEEMIIGTWKEVDFIKYDKLHIVPEEEARRFIFTEDGTWKRLNKNMSIEDEGTYTIRDNTIYFGSSGSTVIKSMTETDLEVYGEDINHYVKE